MPVFGPELGQVHEYDARVEASPDGGPRGVGLPQLAGYVPVALVFNQAQCLAAVKVEEELPELKVRRGAYKVTRNNIISSVNHTFDMSVAKVTSVSRTMTL